MCRPVSNSLHPSLLLLHRTSGRQPTQIFILPSFSTEISFPQKHGVFPHFRVRLRLATIVIFRILFGGKKPKANVVETRSEGAVTGAYDNQASTSGVEKLDEEEGEKEDDSAAPPRRRTLEQGRSDWDDGRWEWQDTPCRDGSSSSGRQHQPSPWPMLLGASPDMRYPSPWLDSHTPRNSGVDSPWDYVSPSPLPIRASGASVRSAMKKLWWPFTSTCIFQWKI